MPHLDVIYAGDPRFPGGTTSATALAIRAARRMELTCGFLPVYGPVLHHPRVMNPRLVREIATSEAHLLTDADAVSCDILFAEHPMVFAHAPSRPIRVTPRRVVCVAQHPPTLADGRVEYDPRAVETLLDRLFGVPVVFAPVGPKVRRTLVNAGLPTEKITPDDLYNIVDPADWARPRRRLDASRPVVVGRHGRPDPLKWPDDAATILAAYPDRPDVIVRVLGGPPPEAQLPRLPSNWQLVKFDGMPSAEFLRGLDFYVYFHRSDWIEAFGIAIAEAMAAGLVVILDRSFETLFEEGAVYCDPGEVSGLIDTYRADPAAYAAQADAARAVVQRKFSIKAYARRMKRLHRWLELDPPPKRASQSRQIPPAPRDWIGIERPRRRILLVSSNGIGIGHLTRLLAVAKRAPPTLEPVFLTLSQAAGLIEKLGYPVDYVPSHQLRGFQNETWNRAFAQELALALDVFEPAAIVFDGSVPYQGLVDVAASRGDLAWFWIRRALWKPGQNADGLERGRFFDAIFEPQELAGPEDVGETTRYRDRVVEVPPVLMLDPADRLSRSAARAELELDGDRAAVCLQLGAGANFNYAAIRRAVLDHLHTRPNLQVVEIVSPIAQGHADDAETASGAPRRDLYPLFRWSKAFDLVITNAGYNSFHECAFGAIPAVYVPNEAPEMDDQLLRARYGEVAGLALTLRAGEARRAGSVLDRALSPGFRAEVERRSARLAWSDGAAAIADLIAQTVYSVRADRPLATAIARI